MLISSMVRATTAEPCSRAIGMTFSMRWRPVSILIELMMARPGYISRAALITSASVESITRGASTPMDSFLIVFAREIIAGNGARAARRVATGFDDGAQVLVAVTAAAADDIDAEFGDKLPQGLSHRLRLCRVDGQPVDIEWDARVGNSRDGQRAVL